MPTWNDIYYRLSLFCSIVRIGNKTTEYYSLIKRSSTGELIIQNCSFGRIELLHSSATFVAISHFKKTSRAVRIIINIVFFVIDYVPVQFAI